MFKKYCPTIAGICQDGHPANKEELCAMWDSIFERCCWAHSMFMTCMMQRIALDSEPKYAILKVEKYIPPEAAKISRLDEHNEH